MTEIFNVASHFIQGKPIYRPVRRMLNLLLNVSIASYFYIRCFGPYQWLDVTDYKGILDFFIQGKFFLPFSIFIVVYAITETFGYLLFKGLTHFWSLRNQRKLLQYSLTSKQIDNGIEGIGLASKAVVPEEMTKEKLVQFYNEIAPEITPEALREMKQALDDPKKNLQSNFVAVIRIMIALLVYVGTVAHLSGGVFVLVLIVLIIMSAFFVIAYRILDVLPALFRMAKAEGDKYLTAEKKNDDG